MEEDKYKAKALSLSKAMVMHGMLTETPA